jgi:hypothetical protein
MKIILYSVSNFQDITSTFIHQTSHANVHSLILFPNFISVLPETPTNAEPSSEPSLSLMTSSSSTEQSRLTVMQSFTEISAKLQLSPELLETHQRKVPIEKRPLLSQLNMISRMFSDVAKAGDSFASLSPEDRSALIKNNSSLYVQYILARYFNASSGLEQVTFFAKYTLDLCFSIRVPL